MNPNSNNILLISGSGRNVGKTSFICKVIAGNLNQKLIAVKITPHFHEPTPGLVAISITPNYRVYHETDSNSGKDSSLFLKSGAEKVFYIQSTDLFLKEAFLIAISECNPNLPIITESAALRKYITPGLYLFIQKKSEEVKPSAFEMQKMADATVFSEDSDFSLSPKSITFNKTWKINDIA
jgi:hypothetical protein